MEKIAWQQAIAGFQKCIKLNKKHPQSFGNLGLCYAQLGQKTDAIAAFDRALEIDPNYEPAMVNKAVVESLPEGEKINQESFESIEYYNDYPFKKRSFIQSFLNEIRGK
ncbi:tetratricopeptide repeat protein [Thermodesulfobacteriota bacterium]